VIAPEGCASILWRDPTRGADAARAMRVTANDARELGLIDEVIPEPLGGAHRDPEATAASIREAILRHLGEIECLPPDERIARRYAKLRALGRLEGL
jgi:acetyl-CoA carboxylase carboxyl transferase subunit alpha